MNQSNDTLEASYTFCRRLSRQSGSNFYLSFLLLPCAKRAAMDALYAFMRHTDDLVDMLPCPQHGIDKTIYQRRKQLHYWRQMLENYVSGGYSFIGDSGNECMRQSPDVETVGKSLLPALVDTVKKYCIPVDYLYAVIEGVEMDLDCRRYETFEELRLYCQRVASAVGLACIHIWGFRGQAAPEGNAALEAARQAGIALQLTNILRDLKADAAAGRIYLPLEDLHNCGYSVEELKKSAVNKAFYRLMALEIDRAEQFYREGYKLMEFLNRDGQRIFGLMMSTYLKLLTIIAQRPSGVLSRQIGLSKLQHILMGASWALMPSAAKEKLNDKISKKLNNERCK